MNASAGEPAPAGAGHGRILPGSALSRRLRWCPLFRGHGNLQHAAGLEVQRLGKLEPDPAAIRGQARPLHGAIELDLGRIDRADPAQNIDGGVHFLSNLLKHYNGDIKLTVAAYNAGPGAVDRYNGIPPYQETQIYVNRVLGYFNSSNESSNEWQV